MYISNVRKIIRNRPNRSIIQVSQKPVYELEEFRCMLTECEAEVVFHVDLSIDLLDYDAFTARYEYIELHFSRIVVRYVMIIHCSEHRWLLETLLTDFSTTSIEAKIRKLIPHLIGIPTIVSTRRCAFLDNGESYGLYYLA